jgi:hypothetical protein
VTAKTRKRWIKDLLAKRKAVERAVGMPLGDMLGCGHFGCVFDSTGPWVVKLTVDPTEGPIWARIVGLIEEEDWGGQGFPRVKDIVRLRPDVGTAKRKRPLYAIVREDCEPCYTLQRGRFKVTDYTLTRLGLPLDLATESQWQLMYGGQLNKAALLKTLKVTHGYESLRAQETVERADEFVDTIKAIGHYTAHAQEYRNTLKHRDPYAYYTLPGVTREQVISRLEQYSYKAHGAIGEPVGESLRMLLGNDVILFDVHLQNIGWRVHEQIGDDWQPDCVVIYDPGHTPTPLRPKIEQRMIENARWGVLAG